MTDVERAATSSRRRILVVDDSALVRLYYRDTLESAGFAVEQAINGIEAMEKVLAQPFDLVIVDVNMPRMDGFSSHAQAQRCGCRDAARTGDHD
jgi:two-component system chemotaxis response regulator CheY